MRIHAYPETYIEDAMNNLGDMFDYAVNDLGHNIEKFSDYFIISGVAALFGDGNPRYVAGLSGVELGMEVIYRTTHERLDGKYTIVFDKSPEYWAGWILAYYQWYSGYTFKYIKDRGVTMNYILSLYPALHEADISKFVSIADSVIEKSKNEDISGLKKQRMLMKLTQKELAELSGVSLRMIQLYEQKKQDINKAQVRKVLNLAKVLHCSVESIVD